MNQEYYSVPADQMPAQVPEYINSLFDIYKEEGLPIGVAQPLEDIPIYYPVSFYKDEHCVFYKEPYRSPYHAHRYFQKHFSLTMRVALQHYTWHELYSECFASGMRRFIEVIEDDFKQGRESVFHAQEETD